jgi:site-specific recombinase XerD
MTPLQQQGLRIARSCCSCRRTPRTAPRTNWPIKAHPHMLRHGCGYALANKGHDTRAIQGWLGHRSITSTAIYTALAPGRFKDFWRE